MKNKKASLFRKIFTIFGFVVVASALTMIVGTIISGKVFFAQSLGDEMFLKAVGELPAMAKVEAQPSPFGEDQALNFAPVFTNKTVVATGEAQVYTDPNTGVTFTDPAFGNAPFQTGPWLGDVPAGQIVLIMEVEKSAQYCRVLGVSLQGWDVDGWMRCDRLGPIN